MTDIRTSVQIQSLRNQILREKHNYYYYSDSRPVIPDAEYDALEDQLRILSPNDPVLAMVGAPVPLDSMLAKASHAMPMGSQSKINSEDEFRAWYSKNSVGSIHASHKGDGGSAALYFQSGRLIQTIGRGDGFEGEDITANSMRFKGLSPFVDSQSGGFTGSVRFEGILTVQDWGLADPAKRTNPRNFGNGIMRRKNGLQSEFITAYAFDIEETVNGELVQWKTEAQKTERLAELGFNVIDHQILETADAVVQYFKNVASARSDLGIWIDGVILKINDIPKQRALGFTDGKPKGQLAWKFDSAGAESVLEAVVLSGGHTGGIFPTAKFRPVQIGGTTVTSALLANFDEIARLDIAVGDSIWVVKANDIIPKIIRVTHRPGTRQPILTPTCCPFCGGAVGRRINVDEMEGVIIECLNGECPKKSIGKINRWITSLGILGIGDVVLRSMIERFDMGDAGDLYTLRDRADDLPDLLTNVEKGLRLGVKRSTSILDGIDETRSLTLSQFLGSLGLAHLGKRQVAIMIKAADGALDSLDDWRAGKLRDSVFAAAVGVPKIGAPIQDAIDAMGPVIEKLLNAGVMVKPIGQNEVAVNSVPLKTICITGTLPSGRKKAYYKEPLRAIGFELVDEVAKGLDYLVAEPGLVSGKSTKAIKLGISIISEVQLADLLSMAP